MELYGEKKESGMFPSAQISPSGRIIRESEGGGNLFISLTECGERRKIHSCKRLILVSLSHFSISHPHSPSKQKRNKKWEVKKELFSLPIHLLSCSSPSILVDCSLREALPQNAVSSFFWVSSFACPKGQARLAPLLPLHQRQNRLY